MLTLGKSFNRNMNLRIPLLDGYYNVGLFYNTKSQFLLFSVDSDISSSEMKHSVKINMFKNIESSKFVETFINLHNYKSQNLDIINQFKEIKPNYTYDVNFIFNETVILSKMKVDDNVFFDQLILYGLTLTSYCNEFVFIIAERQNIISKLRKKVVRTSAIQISTLNSIKLIDEYFDEFKNSNKIDRDTSNNEPISLK